MSRVENYRVEDPAQAEKIEVGDFVRSYDFDAHDDCYVFGLVEEVGVEVEGCPRYRIRCMGRQFGDSQPVDELGRMFFPPVNGARSWLGGYMNGVRKVADQQAWRDKLRDHAEDMRGDY